MTEDEFTAYQSLNRGDPSPAGRSATGFTDPLEEIDVSVPDGVDAAALTGYCLALGDDALIYSHRLQQWMTRMPDSRRRPRWPTSPWTCSVRRARRWPGWGRPKAAAAGKTTWRSSATSTSSAASGWPATDADFAQLPAAGFSAWRRPVRPAVASADPVLAAIAAKGANELAYHRDHAAQWVIRLGDGTPLSHDKMAAALGDSGR